MPEDKFLQSNHIKQTTSPAIAQTSVNFIGPNTARKHFYIWNNSSNSIYITFGPVAVSSSPCFLIPAYSTHVSTNVCWTGHISGIRNAGTGTVTIHEFT